MLALKILNFPNKLSANPAWHYKVLLVHQIALQRLIAHAEMAGDSAKCERLHRRLRTVERILNRWREKDYENQKI